MNYDLWLEVISVISVHVWTHAGASVTNTNWNEFYTLLKSTTWTFEKSHEKLDFYLACTVDLFVLFDLFVLLFIYYCLFFIVSNMQILTFFSSYICFNYKYICSMFLVR